MRKEDVSLKAQGIEGDEEEYTDPDPPPPPPPDTNETPGTPPIGHTNLDDQGVIGVDK